ncbi:MAG TPA: CbiX/SirB N-terminal domain-containing protein [Phycisphaerae bacterium]
MPPSRALVLAAHGSRVHPAGALVRAYAEAARVRGGFDEAVATFWKEAPFFRDVLGMLTADEVTVVPFFTSAGYYCRTVLPREMKLSGAAGTPTATDRGWSPLLQYRRPPRRIRCTAPLGEHSGMRRLIRRRVTDALRAHGLPREETCVVLVGHGTRREPRSGELTLRHADALRRAGVAREVCALFLDQPPEIETALVATLQPSLIVVPYLIGRAGHEIEDLPRRMGLRPGLGRQEVCGRCVVCTRAVGEDPAIVAMILDLAASARTSSSKGPGTQSYTITTDPEGVVSSQENRDARRPLQGHIGFIRTLSGGVAPGYCRSAFQAGGHGGRE